MKKFFKAIAYLAFATVFISYGFSCFANDEDVDPRPSFIEAGYRQTEDGWVANFDAYSEDFKKNDVELTRPEGFRDLNMGKQWMRDFFRTLYYSEYDQGYPVGLISPDGNAAFLYPSILLNCTGFQQRGFMLENELRSFHKNYNLDITPYLEIVNQKDMSHFSNATNAVFYEQNLEDSLLPFLDKYTRCVNVYLTKEKHPCLMLKIMLTEKGYKEKDKYIKTLLDSINYGEGNPFEGQKGIWAWDKRWNENDLIFPQKKNNYSEENLVKSKENSKSHIEEVKKLWKEGKGFKYHTSSYKLLH